MTAIRRGMPRARMGIVLLALALVSSGCLSRAKAAAVLRAAKPVDAQVKASGEWEPLDEGRALASGQQIRTGPKGSVTLASDRTSYELGPSSQLRVISSEHVESLGGDLLTQAGAETVQVDAEGSDTLRARRSIFRLTYGERVVVYRGGLQVMLSGEPIEVGVARELTLGLASAVVRAVAPDPADLWDRRLLDDAIQIDRQLEPYRRTFDVNAPAGEPSIEFLSLYVQRTLIEFAAAEIPTLRLSKFDLLLTALVALERAGLRGTRELQEAWREVLSLRGAGASHGVASQALEITPERLLKRLLQALAGGKPQAPEPQKPPPGKSRPTGQSTLQPTPTSTATSSPRPTPTSSSTPTSTPTPTQTPSESASPSPSPTSTCSPVDLIAGKCTP